MQKADGVSDSLQRFEVLYKSCYQAIYAYVWRRIADGRDDVPDLVAEVFVVAWRRMDAIPWPPRDRLWLYGVARRVVLDHQRRAARSGQSEVTQSWLSAAGTQGGYSEMSGIPESTAKGPMPACRDGYLYSPQEGFTRSADIRRMREAPAQSADAQRPTSAGRRHLHRSRVRLLPAGHADQPGCAEHVLAADLPPSARRHDQPSPRY